MTAGSTWPARPTESPDRAARTDLIDRIDRADRSVPDLAPPQCIEYARMSSVPVRFDRAQRAHAPLQPCATGARSSSTARDRRTLDCRQNRLQAAALNCAQLQSTDYKQLYVTARQYKRLRVNKSDCKRPQASLRGCKATQATVCDCKRL